MTSRKITPVTQSRTKLNEVFGALGSKFGLIGLWGFCYGAFWSPTLSALGLALIGLFIILHLKQLTFIWRDPFVINSLLFAAYLATRTLLAANEFPQTAALQFEEAVDLYQVGFLTAAAFAICLASYPIQSVYMLLLLVVCGLFTRVAIEFDFSAVSEYLVSRPGFGLPVSAFALYCSVAVLGLLVFAPRIWRSGSLRIWRILLWAGAVEIFAAGILISQTRSVFLANILVYPFVVVAAAWKWRRSTSGLNVKKAVGVALIICALFGLTLYLFADQVTGRLNILLKDRQHATSLESFIAGASGDSAENAVQAPDSLGERYHLFRYGIRRWLERPLWGWGPGSIHRLLDRVDIPELVLLYRTFEVDDLHNTYLQILVQIGAVGMLFFLISFYLVCYSLYHALRSRRMALDLFLFITGALAMFAISTAANIRTADHAGHHFVILSFGIAYSMHIRQIQAHRLETPSSNQPTTFSE